VVAGGGTIFVNVIPAVEALVDGVEGDEKTGVRIVAKALEAPIRQIATIFVNVIPARLPPTRAWTAPSFWRRSAPARRAMASTPTRRSTATW